MDKGEDNNRDERTGTEERRTVESSYNGTDSRQKKEKELYLGCLTKQHLIMIAVAVGLVILVVAITVPAVMLTKKPDSPSFPTGGDMLDFLVQTGEISTPDGLLATWVHGANNKKEMNEALASEAMILESDVTLEGYGTANQKPIPIMAHPPTIYSDNTLDEWLDAVLASRKSMKLDFKALEAVGLSLDLLNQKNSSREINRPVWLNADIVQGPNVPDFVPPVNGTIFLQLVQDKFPDVTVSPGWKVLYIPPPLGKTYTRPMIDEMYNMIKDIPQKVTFPVHALLARSGWQHISWLLNQSPRFSLTLWQGSIHPQLSDLVFIRDNTQPAQVYYDIYEPTLTNFKNAVGVKGRLRSFYPGGDLMDFLCPHQDPEPSFLSHGTRCSSLTVPWLTVTDQSSLLTALSDRAGGMLVIRVVSDSYQTGVPVVDGSGSSSQTLTLEDALQMLGQRADAPWGVHLQIHTQQLLEASLQLLNSTYGREQLYRPVWISMEGLQRTDHTQEFAASVERLFPYVTLVLTQDTWPPRVPAAVAALSQRVALHLSAASLPTAEPGLSSLLELMDRYDLIVEEHKKGDAGALTETLLRRHKGRADTKLYVIPAQA